MSERIVLPAGCVGRAAEWDALVEFATGSSAGPTLGIVLGRRRIGKSYLLAHLCDRLGGFYYQAIRGSSSESLRDLGRRIGQFTGAPGAIDFPDWESAIHALLRLEKSGKPVLVVVDEYPYLLEQAPELDSIIQRALESTRTAESVPSRLILCGSAIQTMSALLSGSAPLRGRAAMQLRMMPFDFRAARELHGIDDLPLAVRTFSIVGGVAAYARDMVDGDMPRSPEDFSRWVTTRVLSPAAPLANEVDLLLTEDPTTSQARRINHYHTVLAAVADGHRTPGKISDYARISGPSLNPIINTLVDTGFLIRLTDPIRQNRPTYHPGDPIIRFHYEIIRPRRHGARDGTYWESVSDRFASGVVGPTFEIIARDWFANCSDLAAQDRLHIGSSVVQVGRSMREVDLVAAVDDGAAPTDRTVRALGEAKSGERVGLGHLNRLEEVRVAIGDRAAEASLVLVASAFDEKLLKVASTRSDVEIVDLDRLYGIE